MRNIVLCGFMGCGKSSIGKLLAKELGAGFVDLDDYIENEQGISVPDIFKLKSENAFRDMEHDAIVRLGRSSGIILATGGGALTFERNIAPAKKNGVVVFLNPGFEACYKRIANTDRPIVRANSKEALRKLYKTREPAYKRAADYEIAVSGCKSYWVREIADTVAGKKK